MTFASGRSIRFMGAFFGCLAAATWANAQSTPLTAEKFFKNVKVLTGLPLNEFMTTMGFFSASLGYSCENCHGEDSGPEVYASEDQPKKQIARQMIVMMAAINKTYFGGRQVMTCYSCHRGGEHPKMTPSLAALYSPPPEEPAEIVQQAPKTASVDEIFDKYLKAIGGTERLSALTSFVAKGTSLGYSVSEEKHPMEIYAKAPGQRATIEHSETGDNLTIYDGHVGWMAGPQIAGPNISVPVLELTGGDLEGVKLDAELFFPAQIKKMLGKWRVGFQTEIGDNEVQVVQGTGDAGSLATFYFDTESGLLLRMVRYTSSRVGRFPTQIDYSDYREVAGVKMPFKWTVIWLDGRETFELTDVQPNMPIDAARFAKPAAPVIKAPALPAKSAAQ